jgi:hypothetical protein
MLSSNMADAWLCGFNNTESAGPENYEQKQLF